METETEIAKGICERIGIDGSFIKHTTIGQDAVKVMVDFPDHKVALAKMLSMLTEGETACVKPEEATIMTLSALKSYLQPHKALTGSGLTGV